MGVTSLPFDDGLRTQEGAATTKPAADDDASTSSSSEVARRLASPAAAGAAPWPFIDPSLPTDLPHFLPPRPRREELPLMTILQKIKVRLAPAPFVRSLGGRGRARCFPAAACSRDSQQRAAGALCALNAS